MVALGGPTPVCGREVSDSEMKRVNLERDTFHGEWNYVIKPNVK